jgi:hypothetical protein
MRYCLVAVLIAVLAAGILAGPAIPQVQWVKVDEGKTGDRTGAVLVYAPDLKQMLLVGGTKDGPYVQAFDPATREWSDFSAVGPTKDGINPYYQAAYDPGTHMLYCLSGGPVLYTFNTADKTWKVHPPAPELEGMSWYAMACDPAGKRLVVVGADKKIDNLGWMRTVVYDIPTGKWTRLVVTDEKTEKEHQKLVADREAGADLAARVRMAWFRDPECRGEEVEMRTLAGRCMAMQKLPQLAEVKEDVSKAATTLADRNTVTAMRLLHDIQRKLEEGVEAQYPVPCSRRNSPLVFEPKSGLFVLFGGDHEDYLMNDTWVLDLGNKAPPWRRIVCDKAPSPRAGHALVALPQSGRVVLCEGYEQNSDQDYGVGPSKPLSLLQPWLFDPKAGRWDLAYSLKRGGWDATTPAPVGQFYGYSAQFYSPPAMAADADDTLVLAAPPSERTKRPSQTWALKAVAAGTDTAGRLADGVAPNTRRYRNDIFLASYGELQCSTKPLDPQKLPENGWVQLASFRKNPCTGCRQRDWSTAVWDSDRDEALLWGGGHCVRSSSVVVHLSPNTRQIVEGYDADEPYSGNGSGGYDSSLLNRPWVDVHNYHHYAYDPVCKMLVSGRGYLYDPDRMDWLRMERMALPYKFAWDTTVVATSAHGAVAWARKKTGEDFGLWLFDREKGWQDLQPKGKLFAPYCDTNGMVYDSKRDRMILSGLAGGYEKSSSGNLLAFDFKTRTLETITPANAELGRTHNAREMAYADHADWILIGEQLIRGDEKTGRRFTRIYDCAANKYFLLDAGRVPDGHETGWMYDAARKLVYVVTTKAEVYALRIDPKTAHRVEKSEN